MKALWFSGGKDSVACLLLLKEALADIHVLWANTGKNLPEVEAWVRSFAPMCPNWHEVAVDRAGQHARNGLPSDVVPITATVEGRQFTKGRGPMVQSYLQCCVQNIGLPLWEKTKALGCDVVIRGQRSDESHTSPFRDGSTHDGVTFHHPIEGWTEAEVRDFVGRQVTVPAFYALEHSSVDCYDCTAYLSHSADRVAYLKQHHPAKHIELQSRLRDLSDVVRIAAEPLERLAHV